MCKNRASLPFPTAVGKEGSTYLNTRNVPVQATPRPYFFCPSLTVPIHPCLHVNCITGGPSSEITTCGPCASSRASLASCCRSTAAERATATASPWRTRGKRRRRGGGRGGRGRTPAPCRPTRCCSCLWWRASGCTRLPCSSARSVSQLSQSTQSVSREIYIYVFWSQLDFAPIVLYSFVYILRSKRIFTFHLPSFS